MILFQPLSRRPAYGSRITGTDADTGLATFVFVFVFVHM